MDADDFRRIALSLEGAEESSHMGKADFRVGAGTTTFGTQGAVEYVCREKSIEELLLRLSVSTSGELKPFEALLRVKVARGVPVETEVVSLRRIN
jgi:hypothetical protein